MKINEWFEKVHEYINDSWKIKLKVYYMWNMCET